MICSGVNASSSDSWPLRSVTWNHDSLFLQVLVNVARRLAEFQGAGFVHRDLEPANVMWLPRENRWTVIDFGCAAQIGEEAPLSFTLVYAAPEVLIACGRKETTIMCNAALDTWALGVMAFELLSGEPAFHPLMDGKAKVCAQELAMCRSFQLVPVRIMQLCHFSQRMNGQRAGHRSDRWQQEATLGRANRCCKKSFGEAWCVAGCHPAAVASRSIMQA
jgi:serine/threonine protein kinase